MTRKTLKLQSGEYSREPEVLEACAKCHFAYRMPNQSYICRRYPTAQKVEEMGWCGEFQLA